jgi:hypothetical protein
MAASVGVYLNGWFPPIVLGDQDGWVYHLHVASEIARELGEWVWVGRAAVGDDAS